MDFICTKSEQHLHANKAYLFYISTKNNYLKES